MYDSNDERYSAEDGENDVHDSTAERCCTNGSEMMCTIALMKDAVLRQRDDVIALMKDAV